MNLLHISPRLSPGGINQLAADMAVGLQQAGFRNTVISPPNELVGRMAASSVQHQNMRSLSLFNYRAQIRRIGRIMRSTRSDLILTYTTQATYLAWMACKNLPEDERPRLIGIHTTYPRLRGWMLSLECCDALVATSRHLRDELIRRASLDADRHIWIVPYGVNEELCNPSYTPSATWLEQWKRSYPQNTPTLNICLAGAISPLHGHEDLPDILQKLNEAGVNARVFIAGDTARAKQRYLSKIQKLFKTRGISRQVIWLGNRSDLRDVLCASDVVISLTRQPACHDRAILEALSLGKPVAGYDHGIVGELLDTYLPEGRVEPGDTAGIADRLEQWNAYRPVLEGSLLRPYRLADTIRGIAELCTSVCQGRNTAPNH